jgi:trehalose 6-phosphate synthase
LGNATLIVVSNREPYIHDFTSSGVKLYKTPGGLVAALDPVMQALNGTWIAWGTGDADKLTVDAHDKIRVPPDEPQYTLRRVWLTKEEEENYYLGFANQTLWPLCHIVYQRPVFDKTFWETYKKVNRRFADVIIEELEEWDRAFVWVQDYHLALCPRYIKDARPDVVVGHFWHIPWPNPEAFRICPWKREILDGLLAADLIGFHLKYHCENFLDTVALELETKSDYDKTVVTYQTATTKIGSFPISVDFDNISARAKSERVQEEMQRIKTMFEVPFKYIVLSVDRIDYTKGIIERFEAIDKFLEQCPEYQKQIIFVNVFGLSRMHIPIYKELLKNIESIAEDINWKYRTDHWYPIIILKDISTYPTQLAFYRMADLCLLTPLHDGMNMVAKEFVAANVDMKGILVLSQFTGASRELIDAIIINPYDISATANAIEFALKMPRKEREKRTQRLREHVEEYNVYKWVNDFISALFKLE